MKQIVIATILLVAFAGTVSVSASVASAAAALTVTPGQVKQGEFVTIEGTGFPANSSVALHCAISNFTIPVSPAGQYEYGFYGLNISTQNTSFVLRLHRVQNDTEMVINTSSISLVLNKTRSYPWLNFSHDEQNYTTEISSTSKIPQGRYNITLRGTAEAEGNAEAVYIDLTITDEVMTDASGEFCIIIDTHGIPPGQYNITADGYNASFTLTTPKLSIIPSTVASGEFVTIEGTGFPANSSVALHCAISNFTIPVSPAGQYEYGFYGLNISTQNTSFVLRLHRVQNDTEMVINTSSISLVLNKTRSYPWLNFSHDEQNYTTEISSTSKIPQGRYNITLRGTAEAEGNAEAVYIDLTITDEVMTDASGEFCIIIDTHGIPPGQYNITADGYNASFTLTTPKLSIIPSTVASGEFVTIEGTGFPHKPITLSCTVTNHTINVSEGEYKDKLEDFNISYRNTSLLLMVHGVKNDIAIRIPVWINWRINKDSFEKLGFVFRYYANNSTATVYHGMPIPTGIYDIEVRGTAIDPNATTVSLDVAVDMMNIMPDETGTFCITIDTHGIPTGQYNITAKTADGDKYNASLLIKPYPAPTPTPTPTPTLSPTPTPTPTSRPGVAGGGGGGALLDSDGDGITDIMEMLKGTDPEDPCDPNPNCVACLASRPTTPAPAPSSEEVWVPELSPSPVPVTTPTPGLSGLTPTPVFPMFDGLSRTILLIVVIAAVITLMFIVAYLYRRYKETEEGGTGKKEKIIWR